MRNLKGILLSVVLCIFMIFVGCSQEKVNTNETLSNEKYSEELRFITKSIFEDENYQRKDKVEVFTKDMNLKAKEDENNQWYYNDQSYLLSIKNMYLDLHSKLSELTCSDEVTASIHGSILAQSKDLANVTSMLLQEYSNNTDPQLLNTSIPNIKLIFTDNPNEYTVSELVRNEVNGRIKRINSSIEGITNENVLDVSKGPLNSSDNNINKNEEVKKVENSQDDIEKARKLVLEAIGENETNVIVEYLANPGDYVDSNKYYVFSMSARDGSFVSDVNYLVEKSTFEVHTCSPYGDISKIDSGQQLENSSNNNSSNVNSNQISGGITCQKALEKITQGYGSTYQYNGSPNGEISYEMFNSVEGKEEPSYLFGFTNLETGEEYLGWVYGDGDYSMRICY